MHNINIKFMVLLYLCVSFQRPCLGEPGNSFPQRIFNLLFPMVTVELRNNASHHVHVKCGVEEFKEEMMLLNAGDAISWEFREILFPLKWCYVHIDNDNQGVFWASHLLEIIIKNQNGGSNGKLEEIPRVESEDKIKEVIPEELKTEVESVTVSAVDENSEAVNENHDEEPNEKSPPQVVDSGEFQEEKEVTVSVVDSVTQSEELISDGEEAAAVVQIIDALEDDVTSLDSKETEEASNEINGVPENDGISPVVTKEVSKVIEEIKLPSLEENGEVPLPVAINEEKSREIEDTKLPGSIQNTGESSYTADKEYKQEVDKSLPAWQILAMLKTLLMLMKSPITLRFSKAMEIRLLYL